MKREAMFACSRRLLLSGSGVPLALGLGLLGIAAWAAAPRAGVPLTSDRFSQACAALESGDLDSAAQDIRALREANPELPEARLLESLLTLRRERPSLDAFDAFLQTWNDIGRPDFSDSRLLPNESPDEYTLPEESELRTGSSEAEVLLALSRKPDAKRGRLILQHLRELNPPELIFAADSFLRGESLPRKLRAQASEAVRTRLSELTLASPKAMQYPALLLLEGSSPDAPFTLEDLGALEAIAALPDWRETDFHTIYQQALRHFEAAGHSQPTQAAYMLAVESVANEPAYLLFKRTEASEAVLSPAELRRLGEALWRIGSRMAEESTLLERMLGTRLMLDGARLVGDEARGQQASALREDGAAAMKAMSRAALIRWPLRSTREAFKQAMLRDEMECMLRFVPPAPSAGKAP